MLSKLETQLLPLTPGNWKGTSGPMADSEEIAGELKSGK